MTAGPLDAEGVAVAAPVLQALAYVFGAAYETERSAGVEAGTARCLACSAAMEFRLFMVERAK